MAAHLQQIVLAVLARLCLSATGAGRVYLCRAQESSRAFRGRPDQVAAVRRFVGTRLDCHPAAEDAVLIASELASNAIVHTASGRPGGLFLVYVSVLDACHAAIVVTDQGSHRKPAPRHATGSQETGRGLDIVTAIAAHFASYGGPVGRTTIAIAGQSAA